MLLTKEQIQGYKLVTEKFDCEPYGLDGEVLIQELTIDDRDELELSVIKNDVVDLQNLRAKTLTLSLIDENGNKIFSMKDAKELGKLSGRLLVDMYAVVKRLSGLGEDEINKIEKKLEPSEKKDLNSD